MSRRITAGPVLLAVCVVTVPYPRTAIASKPSSANTTEHWAFQPIKRPAVPSPESQECVRTPVDAFIAAKHSEHGLQPAPTASRHALIRRLSLDLRGFPPTREEVERFLADDVPGAWERLVESMLASPHYGERWGRHWLDVARWAESEGYESNHTREAAWRYRDYVIASFNEDKPFDLFLRQQLAGDEMVPYSDENLIATGFLAAARLSSNEEDKWLQRNAVLVDVVNAVGNAFLGLTINCAQCHDHKFDPITTRDYYRLQAFFAPGQPINVTLREPENRHGYKGGENERARDVRNTLFETARQRLIAEVKKSLPPEQLEAVETPADERTVEQELAARKANLKFQKTPGGIKKYLPEEDRKRYRQLEEKVGPIRTVVGDEPRAWGFYSPVTSPHDLEVLPMKGFYPLRFDPEKLRRAKRYVCIRGDVHNIGPQVKPGWPAVFDQTFEHSCQDARPSSRLELADWLTDARNPLTARVWVNRVWHCHFGRGLVATPNDFGVKGDRPSHPKLLDWLASELIENGWSTKHIHRLILNSATWRLASTVSEELRAKNAEIDPENELLWHWKPRRLEAEAIRDAMLTVTGELDRRLGGPSVPPDDHDDSTRRSLYLTQKRGVPPELQKLFDGPTEVAESCPRRETSTSPLQSLYLLNDEFTLQRAKTLAEEISRKTGGDRTRQIETAFRRTLGRSPDNEELQAARTFFENYQTGHSDNADGPDGGDPLVQFCQALLNLNEFVYVE